MNAPAMPQLTPEQMQTAMAHLGSIDDLLMLSVYLTPDKMQYQIARIGDNRGAELIASVVIVGFLATGAVVLRLLCRRRMKVVISYDDYFIIAGLIQFAFKFLWAVAMTCIKLSILLFYRRLFPRQSTSARWRTFHWALCSASVGLAIITIFGTAFQCTPIPYLWDRTVPGGRCIDYSVFARFTNVGNMLTDILILAMPVSIVWSLHLDTHKKLGVCAMFLLGGFTCIAGVVRFCYLENVGKGSDPTWDTIDSAIWATVEPCIGIVSACLPVMAPLFRTHITSFPPLSSEAANDWEERVRAIWTRALM
ncbi:MAG: hypothetical protein Q9208_008495 [Pyrenodesmia sp. 3 TL-2023]